MRTVSSEGGNIYEALEIFTFSKPYAMIRCLLIFNDHGKARLVRFYDDTVCEAVGVCSRI